MYSFGATLFCLMMGEGEPFPWVELRGVMLAADKELCARACAAVQQGAGNGAGTGAVAVGAGAGAGAGAAVSAGVGAYAPNALPGASAAPSPAWHPGLGVPSESALLAFSPAGLTAFEAYLLHANEARRARGLPQLSQQALSLLAQLLRLTPALRPQNFEQVLAHPWFEEAE